MSIWQRLTDFVSSATRAGSVSDVLGSMSEDGRPARERAQTDVRFTMALIALCAKMARSDGAVTRDEVEAFRRVVDVPDGEADNVRRLFDLAKQDVAGYPQYASQIRRLFGGDKRLLNDVIEALCVIAAADGVLHVREDEFLATVAERLGVPASEMDYVRSLFVNDVGNPYRVLGLAPSASDAEIKARHRALVTANHPDRLTGRGVPAEFVAVAERKLAAINAAYDRIAKERGLKR